MSCGKEHDSLDDPKGNRSMCKDFLKGNELVPKGRGKADKDESTTEADKKVQVEKKCQATINFPSATKTPKEEDSSVLTVVRAKNKHATQVAVKRNLLKL